MAYDNNEYPNRKDWITPYYKKAPSCSRGCRNHGTCKICENNRLHSKKVIEQTAQQQLEEYTLETLNEM